MAGDRGVTDHSLEARIADLEAVADDAEYDTVLSCIGVMFATLKPYAPPPPPGASPAPLWGRADHVRALFGDWVTGLVARQQNLRVDRFATGAEFRDFFKINYGPTIAVYRFIADTPTRSRRSTRSWRPWAIAISPAARWRGSTCW